MRKTGYVYRGGNSLDEEQKQRLLADYALLPRDKGGKIRQHYLSDLARHWGVSDSFVRKLVKARGV